MCQYNDSTGSRGKTLHFKENDECQYLLTELLDIYKSFLNNVKKDIPKKTLKEKPTKKYGDQVIITTIFS